MRNVLPFADLCAAYGYSRAAVGADSTTKLTRAQHHELMLRLGRYPDSPKWQTRAQRRRVPEKAA